MDCCEFRAHAHAHGGAQYGARAAGWECAPYAAPLPYAPYAYYPALDPYRYYRYDYAQHAHHNDHLMPMDYGGYASKEARLRRALARRDACALPPHHLPLPPTTPPLECGLNRRGPTYCEPPTWPHYQMGLGGWNGSSAIGPWDSRNACARENVRYPSDFRPVKGSHLHAQSQVCPPDERSTPYPIYDESTYNGDGGRHSSTLEFRAAGATGPARAAARELYHPEPRTTPPVEKRPPVVPLPAFQQAFGSTEIGKFAEAFSRTEVALDESSSENYSFESFPEWEPSADPQWPSPTASREIKCEDMY